MAKSNSVDENTNLGTVESFIIETLLKGGNVVIPGFGHLELKSISDNRQTVFFKSNDKDDSFLRVMTTVEGKGKTVADALSAVISTPLKEGQTVNLPKVGIFKPKKNENGDAQASFMLSSYLRGLLNGGEVAVEVKEPEKVKETEEKIASLPVVVNEIKNEVQNVEVAVPVDKTSIASVARSSEKNLKTIGVETPQEPSKGGVIIVPKKPKQTETNFDSRLGKKTGLGSIATEPQEEQKRRSWSRNISGSLLIIAVILALILLVVMLFFRKTPVGDLPGGGSVPVLNESVSLPSLAERHYGHPAFWIYIYEANTDKLNSPTNIPRNVQLIIPNLAEEFDVDVTDSLEIKRANILSDIILKKGKITIK